MTTGVACLRTLAIHDLDGSVSGMGNSSVLLHDGENDSVCHGRHLQDPADLERLGVHG